MFDSGGFSSTNNSNGNSNSINDRNDMAAKNRGSWRTHRLRGSVSPVIRDMRSFTLGQGASLGSNDGQAANGRSNGIGSEPDYSAGGGSTSPKNKGKTGVGKKVSAQSRLCCADCLALTELVPICARISLQLTRFFSRAKGRG